MDKKIEDQQGFQAIRPEDIGSKKANLQFLILRQLDRTNFLMTMVYSGDASESKNVRITLAIENGMRSIESMISPFLPKSYYEEVEPIKEKLRKPVRVWFRFEDKKKAKGRLVNLVDASAMRYLHLLSEWYDVLTKNLNVVGLLPVQETEFITPKGRPDNDRKNARLDKK